MTNKLTASQRIGALLWLTNLQYFIVQYIVARSWTPGFSLRHNTISDLGNTVCGAYGDRLVCSPQHSLMNASFIILGLTILGGVICLWRFKAGFGLRLALGGFLLSALGTLLVGFFPENSSGHFHVAGAALSFIFGNLGLIAIGLAWPAGRRLRLIGLIFGMIGIAALILFVTKHYLGLGSGGMERLTAYPQTVWMILAACSILWRLSQRISGSTL